LHADLTRKAPRLKSTRLYPVTLPRECRTHDQDRDDGPVSFDLKAFPPSGPGTALEVRWLLDAEQQRLINETDDALAPFGSETTQFVDEIRRRWPSLEDNPDSPWSVSPDWKPMTGGGTGFAVAWSRADEMRTAILEIAARSNAIIYDPQAGEVILPPGLT
jgi:hypothetical protein